MKFDSVRERRDEGRLHSMYTEIVSPDHRAQVENIVRNRLAEDLSEGSFGRIEPAIKQIANVYDSWKDTAARKQYSLKESELQSLRATLDKTRDTIKAWMEEERKVAFLELGYVNLLTPEAFDELSDLTAITVTLNRIAEDLQVVDCWQAKAETLATKNADGAVQKPIGYLAYRLAIAFERSGVTPTQSEEGVFQQVLQIVAEMLQVDCPTETRRICKEAIDKVSRRHNRPRT